MKSIGLSHNLLLFNLLYHITTQLETSSKENIIFNDLSSSITQSQESIIYDSLKIIMSDNSHVFIYNYLNSSNKQCVQSYNYLENIVFNNQFCLSSVYKNVIGNNISFSMIKLPIAYISNNVFVLFENQSDFSSFSTVNSVKAYFIKYDLMTDKFSLNTDFHTADNRDLYINKPSSLDFSSFYSQILDVIYIDNDNDLPILAIIAEKSTFLNMTDRIQFKIISIPSKIGVYSIKSNDYIYSKEIYIEEITITEPSLSRLSLLKLSSSRIFQSNTIPFSIYIMNVFSYSSILISNYNYYENSYVILEYFLKSPSEIFDLKFEFISFSSNTNAKNIGILIVFSIKTDYNAYIDIVFIDNSSFSIIDSICLYEKVIENVFSIKFLKIIGDWVFVQADNNLNSYYIPLLYSLSHSYSHNKSSYTSIFNNIKIHHIYSIYMYNIYNQSSQCIYDILLIENNLYPEQSIYTLSKINYFKQSTSITIGKIRKLTETQYKSYSSSFILLNQPPTGDQIQTLSCFKNQVFDEIDLICKDCLANQYVLNNECVDLSLCENSQVSLYGYCIDNSYISYKLYLSSMLRMNYNSYFSKCDLNKGEILLNYKCYSCRTDFLFLHEDSCEVNCRDGFYYGINHVCEYMKFIAYNPYISPLNDIEKCLIGEYYNVITKNCVSICNSTLNLVPYYGLCICKNGYSYDTAQGCIELCTNYSFIKIDSKSSLSYCNNCTGMNYNQCLLCKNNNQYPLDLNNPCSLTCENQFFLSSISKTCIPCNDDNEHIQESSCIRSCSNNNEFYDPLTDLCNPQCSDPSFFKTTSNQYRICEQCPSNKYALTTSSNSSCVDSCPLYYISFSNNYGKYCKLCQPGTYFENGECVKICNFKQGKGLFSTSLGTIEIEYCDTCQLGKFAYNNICYEYNSYDLKSFIYYTDVDLNSTYLIDCKLENLVNDNNICSSRCNNNYQYINISQSVCEYCPSQKKGYLNMIYKYNRCIDSCYIYHIEKTYIDILSNTSHQYCEHICYGNSTHPYYENGICVESCSLPGLSDYTSDYFCTACPSQNKYYSKILNTCESNCLVNEVIKSKVYDFNITAYYCDVCIGNMFVEGNECVEKCGKRRVPDLGSMICVDCPIPNYILNNITCTSTCPSGSYIDNVLYTCTYCNSSDASYINYDNTCIDECPINTIKFSQNKTCIKCKDDQKINNQYNICVSDCGKNEYYNKNTRRCMTCSIDFPYYDPNLLLCVSSCPENSILQGIICTLCEKFIYKNGNKCLDICPTSYMTDFTRKQCVNCQEKGMYLFQNDCVSSCPSGFTSNTENKCEATVDLGLTNKALTPLPSQCKLQSKVNENGKCTDKCSQSMPIFYEDKGKNEYFCKEACPEGYIKSEIKSDLLRKYSLYECMYCDLYIQDKEKCINNCDYSNGYGRIFRNNTKQCVLCQKTQFLNVNYLLDKTVLKTAQQFT